MRRSNQTIAFVSVIVSAMITISPNANAQYYSCGQGTPYNGTCLAGTTSSGHTAVVASSTAGTAVSASDSSTGYGVSATSTSGIGVSGNSTSGDGVYGQSSSAYGVHGYSSSGYGVYGHSTYSDGGHFEISSGYSAVAAENGSSGTGLYASAVGGYGVKSNASSGGVGVYGSGSGTYSTGVWGYCSGSPCNAGYFQGNVYATGSITQNSDSRLKRNIAPLSGATEQLLQLEGVTFEWNEPGKHGDQTGTQRGFVAQDVEKVFPGWVGVDKDGFKTLSVQQIEALEVESIRELKAANDDLRGKLEANQARTAKLEDRLNALQNGRDPITGGVGVGRGTLCLIGLGLAGAFGISRRKRSQKTA